MRAKYQASLPDRRVLADVAGPHRSNRGRLDCYFGKFSAMILRGRTQAAYFLKRRLLGAMPANVQEYWSRGCRRAHVSYLVFACWRLLPLAQRKKKPSPLWKSRLRPNQPTRANTSELIWRADQTRLARHAVFAGPEIGPNAATFGCRSLEYDVRETSKDRTFILKGGLSACLDLVLQTVAAPFPKDRNLC